MANPRRNQPRIVNTTQKVRDKKPLTRLQKIAGAITISTIVLCALGFLALYLYYNPVAVQDRANQALVCSDDEYAEVVDVITDMTNDEVLGTISWYKSGFTYIQANKNEMVERQWVSTQYVLDRYGWVRVETVENTSITWRYSRGLWKNPCK